MSHPMADEIAKIHAEERANDLREELHNCLRQRALLLAALRKALPMIDETMQHVGYGTGSMEGVLEHAELVRREIEQAIAECVK